MVSQRVLLFVRAGSGSQRLAERPLRRADHAGHLHPDLVAVHGADRRVVLLLHADFHAASVRALPGGRLSNGRGGREALDADHGPRNGQQLRGQWRPHRRRAGSHYDRLAHRADGSLGLSGGVSEDGSVSARTDRPRCPGLGNESVQLYRGTSQPASGIERREERIRRTGRDCVDRDAVERRRSRSGPPTRRSRAAPPARCQTSEDDRQRRCRC